MQPNWLHSLLFLWLCDWFLNNRFVLGFLVDLRRFVLESEEKSFCGLYILRLMPISDWIESLL